MLKKPWKSVTCSFWGAPKHLAQTTLPTHLLLQVGKCFLYLKHFSEKAMPEIGISHKKLPQNLYWCGSKPRRKKRMTWGTESVHQVSRRTTILPQQSILYLWIASDCPQVILSAHGDIFSVPHDSQWTVVAKLYLKSFFFSSVNHRYDNKFCVLLYRPFKNIL